MWPNPASAWDRRRDRHCRQECLRSSGSCARCTLSGALRIFGRYCQTSSQVKLMIGASNRASASPIRQIAVCARGGLRFAEPKCTGGPLARRSRRRSIPRCRNDSPAGRSCGRRIPHTIAHVFGEARRSDAACTDRCACIALERNCIFCRIEIVQSSQNVAEGVADLA